MDETLTLSDKINRGKQLKTDGNEHFKAGKYQDALREYHFAL
jgi:hypothetical protein